MDQKAIKDAGYDEGVKYGIQQGMQQGTISEKIETAKKLKEKNIDIQFIIAITGFTKK